MNSKIKKILSKKNKKKIICLTAYSKSFAEVTDKYADITLVAVSYTHLTLPTNREV